MRCVFCPLHCEKGWPQTPSHTAAIFIHLSEDVFQGQNISTTFWGSADTNLNILLPKSHCTLPQSLACTVALKMLLGNQPLVLIWFWVLSTAHRAAPELGPNKDSYISKYPDSRPLSRCTHFWFKQRFKEFSKAKHLFSSWATRSIRPRSVSLPSWLCSDRGTGEAEGGGGEGVRTGEKRVWAAEGSEAFISSSSTKHFTNTTYYDRRKTIS